MGDDGGLMSGPKLDASRYRKHDPELRRPHQARKKAANRARAKQARASRKANRR